MLLKLEWGAVQACANIVELEKCCNWFVNILIAKIGFDRAENEPSKIWQTLAEPCNR